MSCGRGERSRGVAGCWPAWAASSPRTGPTTLSWSCAASVELRREICVLLTAEIVGPDLYRIVPLAHEDPVLAAASGASCVTSAATIAFHRATLSREFFQALYLRSAAILSWRSFRRDDRRGSHWITARSWACGHQPARVHRRGPRERPRPSPRAIRSPHLLSRSRRPRSAPGSAPGRSQEALAGVTPVALDDACAVGPAREGPEYLAALAADAVTRKAEALASSASRSISEPWISIAMRSTSQARSSISAMSPSCLRELGFGGDPRLVALGSSSARSPRSIRL